MRCLLLPLLCSLAAASLPSEVAQVRAISALSPRRQMLSAPRLLDLALSLSAASLERALSGAALPPDHRAPLASFAADLDLLPGDFLLVARSLPTLAEAATEVRATLDLHQRLVEASDASAAAALAADFEHRFTAGGVLLVDALQAALVPPRGPAESGLLWRVRRDPRFDIPTTLGFLAGAAKLSLQLSVLDATFARIRRGPGVPAEVARARARSRMDALMAAAAEVDADVAREASAVAQGVQRKLHREMATARPCHFAEATVRALRAELGAEFALLVVSTGRDVEVDAATWLGGVLETPDGRRSAVAAALRPLGPDDGWWQGAVAAVEGRTVQSPRDVVRTLAEVRGIPGAGEQAVVALETAAGMCVRGDEAQVWTGKVGVRRCPEVGPCRAAQMTVALLA